MSAPPLDGVLHDYGEDWQIEQEPAGLWVAIRRPEVKRLPYYVADTLAQLVDLLANDAQLRRS